MKGQVAKKATARKQSYISSIATTHTYKYTTIRGQIGKDSLLEETILDEGIFSD